MTAQDDYIKYLESRVDLLDAMITEREAMISCLLMDANRGIYNRSVCVLAYNLIGETNLLRNKQIKRILTDAGQVE